MRLSLLLVFISINFCFGQRNKLVKGDIYALIVGVSDYADNGPTDLDFAHKDAEVFAEYLMSDAGGNVPQENIKLLTDSKATISNVYNAKRWVEDQAGKKDLVYLYFSGHGDVEDGVHKRGYLLLHDSPTKNYENNALRIEDLNATANTLSVNRDAQVVIITDACHSGKLSGTDNARSRTLGDRLVKVQKNEVRIASCESHQESQENAAWGGGRSAFSFYMINGLKGLADDNGNGKVTLGELEEYLAETVPDDVEKITSKFQDPVVEGKSRKKMAIIDKTTLEGMSNTSADLTQATVGGVKSVVFGQTEQDIYFSLFTFEILKESLDFRELANMNSDQVVHTVINNFRFDNVPEISDSEWLDEVRSDAQMRNTFKPDLAAVIHNEVQRVINLYLAGDKDELERRLFYNASNSDFGEYQYMLQTAMNLLPPNSRLHDIIQIKKHYFAGVAARMQIFIQGNMDSLLNVALAEQEKALALNDKAAYIHNEMGVVYTYQKEYHKAIEKFKLASSIENSWSIPMSNLANSYYRLERYQEGFDMASNAVDNQPEYVNGQVSKGSNAVKINDYLTAEDCFRKGIALNANSFQSHDGLGETYLYTMEYEDANFHFQTAEEIRRGLNLNMLPMGFFPQDMSIDNAMAPMLNLQSDDCDYRTEEFGDNDVMVYFSYGYKLYLERDYDEAEAYFKKAISNNTEDPITYHYLAKLYYDQANFIAAQLNFELAKEYYLPKDLFDKHADSLEVIQEYTDCNVVDVYRSKHYEGNHNQYFLGDVNTIIGHYTEAEDIYRFLINEISDSNSDDPLIPYKLLWELYTKRDLWNDAEAVIEEYRTVNATLGLSELYEYFSTLSWKVLGYSHKAGLLTYNMFKAENENEESEEYRAGKLFRTSSHSMKMSVPGTEKSLYMASNIDLPVAKSIDNFESSLAEQTDSLQIGDTYSKLGELYSFLGMETKAYENYQLATKYNFDNATPFSKAIAGHILRDEFVLAYSLLNEMLDSTHLDYDNQMTISHYDILSGNYDRADSLIAVLDNAHAITNKEIEYWKSLKHMLKDEWSDALPYFTNWSISEDDNDYVLYTLSRIHAQLGNKETAEDYLVKADSEGFNYYWVLKNDSLIETLRDTDIYIDMINKYYPFPDDIIRQ